MFERRLRVLLCLSGIALLIVIGRLAQLQIVQAGYYRSAAQASLLLRPTQTPFVRGSIVDRTGEVLVRDEACWDVAIDFAVLAADVSGDADGALRVAARYRRRDGYRAGLIADELAVSFRGDLREMWVELARFSAGRRAVAVEELRARAKDIHHRILRIRRAVARRRGFDAPVAEEGRSHAILTELGADDQIVARERFARFPWMQVRSSSVRRFAGDATPLAHLLGRLGRVSAEHVAEDPNADDPFARYRADERLGVSGIEAAAETRLRGRRGQIARNRDGALIAEQSFEAANGQDVTLTVHAELQRRLYQLLGETVQAVPEASGGAIVVVDVESREVLALVSYPSFDPSRFNELYPLLLDDTQRLPLRFRAVASRYAPGSTIKPLVCLAGLISRRITLDTREVCTGYLFDDVRDKWRCWELEGTGQRKAHGEIDVVEALTGSCNVFMFRLGEAIGVDGLCSVFDMAGIGRSTGIGLTEEVWGINPTPGWLMEHKNIRATPGFARQFAIGQGELALTPLQMANLMATYASGRYRPLTVVRSDTPSPVWELPATPAHWQAIRRGIYGVVNDPAGTAYRYAHFVHPRWALCGKTGSATAHPWPTAYRVLFVDQAGESAEVLVRAGSRASAIERFTRERPGVTFDPAQVQVAERWPVTPPARGENHSHAWFGGFLQPLTDDGLPDWSRTSPVAFAVLVEFGGSGGRTSGPLAKSVSAALLDTFGENLDIRDQHLTLGYAAP